MSVKAGLLLVLALVRCQCRHRRPTKINDPFPAVSLPTSRRNAPSGAATSGWSSGSSASAYATAERRELIDGHAAETLAAER
jgi:hypothetical protein